MKCWTRIIWLLGVVIVASGVISAAANDDDTIMLFDFRDGQTHGWTGNPRITNLEGTAEGLSFESVGHDPWIESEVVDALPVDTRVQLIIRMRSDGDSSGEVFYGPTFTPENHVQFMIQPDGEWHEYTVMLTPMPEGSRLRIDPAANEGTFTIAWVKMRPLIPLIDVEMTSPSKPDIPGDAPQIQAGSLVLRHGPYWDAFAVDVQGEEMAISVPESWIGYFVDGDSRRIELGDEPCTIQQDEHEIRAELSVQDSAGATWTFHRRLVADPVLDNVEITTNITVDQDRELYHIPWVTLFPGLNTYGERKTQAILPGVEYLADEPSSSEADLRGEQAIRRIVDDFKLCIPMMALNHHNRYIGINWTRTDHPAPVFDSPDRIFDSDAHLMGLWHPGVGEKRLENELQVYDTFSLAADEPLSLTYTILGGSGESVVPAVQHQLFLMDGLPELPEFEGGFDAAVELLAAGWLDSEAHEDGYWRHAIWPGFGPQPASDAPAYMRWLAAKTDDAELAERLKQGAARGLERLNPDDPYISRISHVARPVMPLLFGRIEEHMEGQLARGRNGLADFDEDGIRRYVPPEEGPDYGETHFADHANGLSAVSLENVLEAAVFTGDEELIREGLALLDRQTELYANTVPRGAQTWEMPLHTPDILASGRLVRCYVLAYQLTEDPKYLEEARYWAWTGVPFVYLDPPTPGPIGLYATIAVLGATNWVAPNWIGLPVQWCGLVYRSALHDLADVDPDDGPFWAKLAKGITLSGLQQTFPLDDESRQGTLPDFFHLKEQVSDGPAIIPGTVQANLAEVYDETPFYQMRRAGESGVLVHVPGGIESISHAAGEITVSVDGWFDEPYHIHMARVSAEPDAVSWNDDEPLDIVYNAARGTLTVLVSGSGALNVAGIE